MGHNKQNREDNKYGTKASNRSIPHLMEKTLIIILGYVFSGLNYIVAGLISKDVADRAFTGIGLAILIIILPLNIMDNRREMRGILSIISSCGIHFVLCFVLSVLFTYWWMVVYVGEAILCFGIILITKKTTRLE